MSHRSQYLDATDVHLRSIRNPVVKQGFIAARDGDTSLPSLVMRDANLGTDKIALLASLLRKNSTVTHLDIQQNRLYSRTAASMAEVLKKNASVTSLDLSSNFLGGCVAR